MSRMSHLQPPIPVPACPFLDTPRGSKGRTSASRGGWTQSLRLSASEPPSACASPRPPARLCRPKSFMHIQCLKEVDQRPCQYTAVAVVGLPVVCCTVYPARQDQRKVSGKQAENERKIGGICKHVVGKTEEWTCIMEDGVPCLSFCEIDTREAGNLGFAVLQCRYKVTSRQFSL